MILPAKWVYSGIAEELQFRTCKRASQRQPWVVWWFLIHCWWWVACCWWVRRKSFFLLKSVGCSEWYGCENTPFGASQFHFKWSFPYFHISKCHFLKLQVSVCEGGLRRKGNSVSVYNYGLNWSLCVLINHRSRMEGDGSHAKAFLIKPFVRENCSPQLFLACWRQVLNLKLKETK